MKEVKNMYIVENELLEEIIKNIIKYINELELITKDKIKLFSLIIQTNLIKL